MGRCPLSARDRRFSVISHLCRSPRLNVRAKFFTFTPANIPSLVSATKVKLIVVQEIPDPELEVLYGVNASDDGLSVIDPTTGVVTFLGSLDPRPVRFPHP